MQFSLVTQACVAGLGVALMPEFLIAPELEKRQLMEIGNTVRNWETYYFAAPKNGTPNSVVLDFKTDFKKKSVFGI